MTVTFDGASTSGERGKGPGGPYPVWQLTGGFKIVKIPGGDKVVIQVTGIRRPRLALTVRVTKTQLDALRGKVGVTGTLVFSLETTTATLVELSEPQEIGAGHDIYFVTMSLIRSSATFVTPSTAWLTQSGEPWLTQGGEVWIEQ